ncbi:MAG: hypothetical protein LBH40_00505 [Alphaproteobacteria bacterium]|jgi:hypothetical protein|nr:hypothetical protein [Alphaproteobacteria bacterium]
MFDGTIRHLPKDNPRELGTYEEDNFKSHNHTQENHTHSLPNITGEFVISSDVN